MKEMMNEREKQYGKKIGIITLSLLVFTILVMLFMPFLSDSNLGVKLKNQFEYGKTQFDDRFEEISENKIKRLEKDMKKIENMGNHITFNEEVDVVYIYLKYLGNVKNDVASYYVEFILNIIYLCFSVLIILVAVFCSVLCIINLAKKNYDRTRYLKSINVLGIFLLLYAMLLSCTSFIERYGDTICIGIGIYILSILYIGLYVYNRIIDYRMDIIQDNVIKSYVGVYKSLVMVIIAIIMMITYFMPSMYYPKVSNQLIKSVEYIVQDSVSLSKANKYKDGAEIEYKFSGEDTWWSTSWGKYSEDYGDALEDYIKGDVVDIVIGALGLAAMLTLYVLIIRLIRNNKKIVIPIIVNLVLNLVILFADMINLSRKTEVIYKFWEKCFGDDGGSTNWIINGPVFCCICLAGLLLAIEIISKKKMLGLIGTELEHVQNTSDSITANITKESGKVYVVKNEKEMLDETILCQNRGSEMEK